MDKLTGQSSDLQIIPIVGMGGIGKTTLARIVYDNSLIVECFYIRAWITISQEYNLQEKLLGLLNETGAPANTRQQESSEYHELGEKLHKHLSGRKYLIIIDDIWSIKVWEKLKLFLPNNNNGSRVMVTTRLFTVANGFCSSHLHEMNLLDEKTSWSLLRRKVFGHDGECPPGLEKVGMDIAKNTKGLPLSIVVIGGLLAKSDMTREYLEYVAEHIHQIVNSADNGTWLKILSLSYNNLPIHLKPCFLYMAVYPEDSKIRVSELIRLWVAEGFLKPDKTKSLEEVAEDCLKDLIERNLILVHEWGSIGKMKTCSIHDLLRDLCLKEAKKERFLCEVKPYNPANKERRIVFHDEWSYLGDSNHFHSALQSTPFTRSLTFEFRQQNLAWEDSIRNLRLLRVLNVTRTYSLDSILKLVNLRYLKCGFCNGPHAYLYPMCQLQYLQTLIMTEYHRNDIHAPYEIWQMPQLRHVIVKYGICLPDPFCDQMNGQDDLVLKNLQTISCIKNFECTEDILKRIPNVNKLSVLNEVTRTSNRYGLHNLGRQHRLQSLTYVFSGGMEYLQYLSFPQSLNKLALRSCYFEWDDFTTKVGSLPHLKKLRLDDCSAGAEWNTVEGKFQSLKFLELSDFDDLVCWTAESTHFPVLERLVLSSMWKLKEIPSGIGDTLQSIQLEFCGRSVIASANEILEEQLNFGNEGLHLTIR